MFVDMLSVNGRAWCCVCVLYVKVKLNYDDIGQVVESPLLFIGYFRGNDRVHVDDM